MKTALTNHIIFVAIHTISTSIARLERLQNVQGQGDLFSYIQPTNHLHCCMCRYTINLLFAVVVHENFTTGTALEI